MPGKNMRGDQSKEMSKAKPIRGTELKQTDISHHIIWKSVKEKRKRKKKKKKGKQLASAPTLGVGSWPAPSGLLGDLGLATTLIRVRHTVSVRKRIAGEIKPVTKGNSIWTNLEELDLDNGARNLPAAQTTAFFCQSSRSQPQEQINGLSQPHRQILRGEWGRASTTRLPGGCSLIS